MTTLSDVRHISVSISRPLTEVYAFASNPNNLSRWATGLVTIHNPMRVLPKGEGSEVVFSVFRRADLSEADFVKDADGVAHDLETLKRLLEG